MDTNTKEPTKAQINEAIEVLKLKLKTNTMSVEDNMLIKETMLLINSQDFKLPKLIRVRCCHMARKLARFHGVEQGIEMIMSCIEKTMKEAPPDPIIAMILLGLLDILEPREKELMAECLALHKEISAIRKDTSAGSSSFPA